MQIKSSELKFAQGIQNKQTDHHMHEHLNPGHVLKESGRLIV
jgi:hypothetical protein